MTDPTPFGTALEERVRDEHPDLDQLIRSSTRAGTRIRRTRRAGVVVAAAAGVAVVAVGVAALQGSDGTATEQPPVADDPTPTAPPSPSPSPTATATPTPTPPRSVGPVSVDAPGWDCDRPMDEKFICTSGRASVVVNWREAAAHDEYQDPAKADSLEGVHTFVSEVHGAWFATVAPALGTTQAQVDEVGAGLVWVE
jgi:hypothetical protein